MKKVRSLILTLVLILISIGTVNAADYSINVEAETGNAGSGLEMSLEGIDEETAHKNNYNYYVRFVNEGDSKPQLTGTPHDSIEGVGNGINSYLSVNVYHDEKNNAYHNSIAIDYDWYMLKGYTKAYIVECKTYDTCSMLENPVSVEKPALPKLTQRYQNFLFTDQKKLSVFPFFPTIGKTGSHEINVKIGLIQDNELLNSIAKDKSGAYEELMEYAKQNDGTIFTAKEDDFTSDIGVDIGSFAVTNGAYYYMYTYYTNKDGMYRNLDDITVVMGDAGMLVNDVVWNNFDTESIWDKFVEKFKDTELVKSFNDTKTKVQIESTTNSLTVILTDETSSYTTKFTYENGIITYVPSDTDEKSFVDSVWVLNSLYALADLKGYDIDNVSQWMEKNKDKSLNIKDDGLEFDTKEYIYEDETEGASVSVSGTIFTSFKLDVKNGLKSYEESFIPHYKFIKGANQKYIISETKELKFQIDAKFDLFDKVYIDGKEVSKSNYVVKSGSTIITFTDEYAKKLSTGKHTLKVTFTDGEFAQTEFTVAVKNPKTGYAVAYTLILVLIALGIVTYFIIKKQSKFPKHN